MSSNVKPINCIIELLKTIVQAIKWHGIDLRGNDMKKSYYEKVDTFIREYDLKNKELPKMYEIIESTGSSIKAIKFYLDSIWPDYPVQKMITREEEEIIKVYDQCENYQELYRLITGSYNTMYTRVKKLISMGVIKSKTEESEIRKEENRKSKGLEVVYIKIIDGEYKGKTGYTLKSNLNNNAVDCNLYFGKNKETKTIRRKYIHAFNIDKKEG